MLNYTKMFVWKLYFSVTLGARDFGARDFLSWFRPGPRSTRLNGQPSSVLLCTRCAQCVHIWRHISWRAHKAWQSTCLPNTHKTVCRGLKINQEKKPSQPTPSHRLDDKTRQCHTVKNCQKIEKKNSKIEISIFWPVQNDFLTMLRKYFCSSCFWTFSCLFRKSSKNCQKRRFWRKRTSETWFSWRNHPDWYWKNRFLIHGDSF